jgi:uncharacterized protein (DUF488 family)
MAPPINATHFFTIGHSTRSVEEFVRLLQPNDIKLVVDVRKIPRSRTNPQFNSRELSTALLQYQIRYEHIAGLGGLRSKTLDVPVELNAFWKNKSFHNYADYATTDEFRRSLVGLRNLGRATTCVIMCAEAVWWRCHRRIITDYLLTSGEIVLHILGPGRVEPARLTDGACITADGSVVYPANS